MRNSYNNYSWSFLIASPAFSDGFFEETAVLVLEDNENGSFGVIINKPTSETLAEMNPSFAGTPLESIEVFDGGPLAKDKINLAACSRNGKSEGVFSFGIPPEQAEEILRADADAKIMAYAGYSGWGENQLQNEINEGTWLVSNADIATVLDIDCDEVWKSLALRECPEYRLLEKPSGDPELN